MKEELFDYKKHGLPYVDQGRVTIEKVKNPNVFSPIKINTTPNNKSRKAMFVNKFK